MEKQLTFLDLFAGLGGARRGMEMAGHKCIGFCEWDKWARASYISMHCMTEEERQKLSELKLTDRQKEVWNNEEKYRHGEWCSNDIRSVEARNIPRVDAWCFGAPCQSFSIAGKRAGLEGESGLIREVFRILGEIEEESRPEWLIYENVKGMLSSNRGFDYLAILLAMDELGYDIEWQLLNSKDFGVPQNRERVYTVGHLRSRGSRKIFPISTASGEDNFPTSLIGHRDGYRRNMQTYSPMGVTEALDTCGGGGREPHVAIPMFGIDYNIGGEERPLANTVKARYDAGVTNFKQDGTAVCVPIKLGYQDGISETDIAPTLLARDYKGVHTQPMAGAAIVIPCLTPDRGEKRQNGRRFKDNGEPSFTLTGLDRHGIGISVNGEVVRINEEQLDKEHPGIWVKLSEECTVYAVWYEKYECYIAIRKLLPLECFRLQGWEDYYFDRAALVNSDTQLYKQAGNGITTTVMYEVAKRLVDNSVDSVDKIKDEVKDGNAI